MAHSTTVAAGSRILPVGTAAFFGRRLSEAAGLALIAGAGLVAMAIVTYAPGDISLNTAAPAGARNALGPYGSLLADVLVQGYGIASFLPVLALAAWGWRLLRKRANPRPWLRLILLMAAVSLLAAGASVLTTPERWPLHTGLGGAVGALAFDGLAALAGRTGITVNPILLAALISAAGLVAATSAMNVTFALLRSGAAVIAAARRLLGGRARLGRLARNRRGGQGRRFEPALAGSVGGEEWSSPSAGAKRAVRVAARESRLKPGKKAEAARQGSFDLEPADRYRLPPLDLLEDADRSQRAGAVSQDALEQNARLLESVLDDFGVRGDVVKVRPGPVVTLYELEPAPGTKTSRVIGLADDIARSMSAVSVRIAVIPGRNVIGLELPNPRRETVRLRELLAAAAFEQSSGNLNLALGKDIGGAPVIVDLARMPHLLIAGTTGSGKSVAVNTMVLALLYQLRPEQCRFIMIDPKMLELSVYEGIPHLLCPVVTEPAKAVVALRWTVREMEKRYRTMSQLGVRSIAGYNDRIATAKRKGETLTRRVQTGFDDEGAPAYEDQPLSMEPLPLIVVVVDEMADLMLVAGKEIEATVQRLSQMARAAGIHLIMATQRPSVDVITGTIKANFASRVSFQVSSKIDSRTILGEQGAEQLLGQGDMLYMAGGGRITRVHGPFVSDEEVENVVNFLKTFGPLDYVDSVTEDDAETSFGPAAGDGGGGDALYDEAVALVARERKASTSFVQRHLQIGYNRAARIVERMETDGVITPADRVGRREVLIGPGGGH